jgi:uncharacterized protein (TIGR02421 family)
VTHTLATHPGLKFARHVDHELAAIAESYALLLTVTPVNSDDAYRQFVDAGCESAPDFQYRPIEINPDGLKRRLYNIPIEHVEDPTLALLLHEKRREIEREINLIEERGTASFRFVGMSLYGGVDHDLRSLAEGILAGLSSTEGEREEQGRSYDAVEFCAIARAEIEGYQRSYPNFHAQCEVREDVTGLIVSRRRLLVGARARILEVRLEAALHHEIGTHILTYYNGKAQPLRLLATGLPNYNELQEGLAVMAEYFSGGFTRARARTLAARVIAVDEMSEGTDFADAFRLLHKEHGFGRRHAFTICMRAYRGGGLTKDAVYLRGLKHLLEYLATGGDYRELFLGKFSLSHVSHLRDLRKQGVLVRPPLEPRYLEQGRTRKRLELLQGGLSVLDLIEKRPA